MNNIQKRVLSYVDEKLDGLGDVRLIGAWAELIPTVMNALEDSREEMLQAKIDALMLEFCPEEMTNEQLITWGEHQQISTVNLKDLF